MNTTSIARAIAAAVIVGGALGLSGCATATLPPGPQPILVPQQAPADQTLVKEYAGRPADRVAEELQRRVGAGELPSSTCRRHTVVEHPDGGYHLVCTMPAPAK
ncbi:hypothetical protein ACH3VR_07890 [Microbacterium sp. B2969]|uniref:Lipoprotein n=1 Tax=Microbacterium alkaliflavum TaxID=3248839 RepID=A0ABW7Q5Y0_9MICO